MSARKVILYAILLVLFFMPTLLWNNHYNLGGDDTRLYYVYPAEYLSHFTFNIISDNTLAGASTGYDSPAYHAPFFIVILLLSYVRVLNPEMILYGLNLAGGFLFFYLFLGLYIKRKSLPLEIVSVLGSLIYIFSLYLIKTFYAHQLISLYQIIVIPCFMYLFVRGVREKNIHFAILAAVVISIFSPVIVVLPWLAGSIIGLSPLLMLEGLKEKKSSVQFVITCGVSFLLFNLYWLFHFVNSALSKSGLATNTSLYTSQAFLEENKRIISGVSHFHSPLNQVFNTLDPNLLKNFYSFTSLNLFFLITIIIAGYFINTARKDTIWNYTSGGLCLILSVFLISPNFGEWGVKVFLFLTNHIPFFSMFRNMYDKFSLSLAFSYAFLFAISLSILFTRVKNNYFVMLVSGIVLLLVVHNGIIFYQDNFSPDKLHSVTSGSFNKDFLALTEYLKRMKNPSRVLWLPLNAPTYVFVQDSLLPDHYYSGTSPLRILANRSDYSGRFSFITQHDVFYGDKVFNLLANKNYDAVGKIYQTMNAKYIIVSKEKVPKELYTWYYSFFGVDMNTVQGKDYQRAILGQKIADFGQLYSLYEIQKRFFTDKIYLSDSYLTFQDSDDLNYEKKSSYEYSIAISSLKGKKKLVFLDPYYKDWSLYVASISPRNAYAKGENVVVHNYANGWEIDSERIKKSFPKTAYKTNPDGSINVHFVLYFQPKDYDRIIYPISIVSFGLFAIYEVYYIRKLIFAKRT